MKSGSRIFGGNVHTCKMEAEYCFFPPKENVICTGNNVNVQKSNSFDVYQVQVRVQTSHDVSRGRESEE